MKIDMSWIKILLVNILLAIVVFIGIDFIYTATMVGNFSGLLSEKFYRIRHPYYSHTLRPDYRGPALWGENNTKFVRTSMALSIVV